MNNCNTMHNALGSEYLCVDFVLFEVNLIRNNNAE
jgi:hypothetical protein